MKLSPLPSPLVIFTHIFYCGILRPQAHSQPRSRSITFWRENQGFHLQGNFLAEGNLDTCKENCKEIRLTRK